MERRRIVLHVEVDLPEGDSRILASLETDLQRHSILERVQEAMGGKVHGWDLTAAERTVEGLYKRLQTLVVSYEIGNIGPVTTIACKVEGKRHRVNAIGVTLKEALANIVDEVDAYARGNRFPDCLAPRGAGTGVLWHGQRRPTAPLRQAVLPEPMGREVSRAEEAETPQWALTLVSPASVSVTLPAVRQAAMRHRRSL